MELKKKVKIIRKKTIHHEELFKRETIFRQKIFYTYNNCFFYLRKNILKHV